MDVIAGTGSGKSLCFQAIPLVKYAGHLTDNSFDRRSDIPDLNSKVVEKGANG